MNNGIVVKIFAFLALAGIVIGLIGTGVLYIFSAKQQPIIENNIKEKNKEITPEDLEKLKDIVGKETGSGNVEINTGTTNTLSGNINN